jgi:hypothetical protein
MALQQNGSSLGYYVTAIAALAGVIAVLGKFFMERLKQADVQLQEERKARSEDTKAFLGQLSDLARQTREAHEREMVQVLNRLERSDQISKQQTEILSVIERKRTR